MNRAQWNELCDNGYILLDGATGSNLMKAGMPLGVCPEKWILEHPQAIIDLQRAYVEAGSNIVYAPTFTANRIKLKEYGLYEKQEEMIKGLVSLSKEAVGDKAYIAGDITMTGQQLAPIGMLDLEELIDIYKEQIIYMEKAGVDLLVVETMMSLAETRAAVIAAKEVSNLPIMVTMTFEANGKTLFGTDSKTAGIVLESLGVDAVGVNCSAGPAAMAQIVKDMAEVTTIPLIAKPNAGLPVTMPDGSVGYAMSPSEFAEEMKLLTDSGATILGGCCGTSPAFIKALNEKYGDLTFEYCDEDEDVNVEYITSERKVLCIEDSSIEIGERINAGIDKDLQEDLMDEYTDLVLEYAEEQEDDGAEVLNINLDMSGIDVREMMIHVIEDIQSVTTLPLSFESSHVDVIETALRHYPGRALVRLTSFDSDKNAELLPIIEKYGAILKK